MSIKYKEFASEISFFEFLEEEFSENAFPQKNYIEELELLNKIKNINDLAKSLELYPKLFDLYESYFQISTFSVAQYSNFLFDVQKLNYNDESSLNNYCKNSCLSYENGEPNKKFQYYYNKIGGEKFNKYIFKRAIAEYVNCLQKSKIGDKNRVFLLDHISKNITTRARIAEYLVNKYNLIEHSTGNLIEKSLLLKRHQIDPKSFSGKYGSYRVEKCLGDKGFSRLPSEYSKTIDINEERDLNGFHYVREAKITSSKIGVNFSNKVFDFILLKNGVPFFLIETNFYSTSGSKIGINESEYISLAKDIKVFSNSNGNILFFSWITDGNYWLSTGGMNKWENIRKSMDGDFEILNYSLFGNYLPKIKNLI